MESLAEKYASDKLHFHSYIPFYAELFRGFTPRHVLEIGIGYRDLMQPLLPPGVEYVHGSSLRMWSELWPEADIFACDIREDTLVNEGQIRSVVADQSNPDSLLRMVEWAANLSIPPFGGFDLIIDDGSHQFEHQLITMRHLWPFVSPGGLYVIEDTYPDKGLALAGELGGHVNCGTKRPDDCVVWRRK